ncbi:MAG TPA: hypothetical protein VKR52_00810 [Terracidiphilus sp.]|nr:hypothetical protein [Terracidiphilus sp.]
MDETVPSAPSEPQPAPAAPRPDPGPATFAVARCGQAYTRALKTALAQGQSRAEAVRAADMAFRAAMPQLLDSQGVLDFIACVTQGMLLGAIPYSQSSRLLYAAQVAAGALRNIGSSATREPDLIKILRSVNLTRGECDGSSGRSPR